MFTLPLTSDTLTSENPFCSRMCHENELQFSHNHSIQLPLKSIGYIQAFGWVYDKFDSSCLLENSNTFFTFLRKFFFRPFNELCWVSKLATFSFNTLFHFFCSLFFIPSSVRIYCLSEGRKRRRNGESWKKNHAVNSKKKNIKKLFNVIELLLDKQKLWAFPSLVSTRKLKFLVKFHHFSIIIHEWKSGKFSWKFKHFPWQMEENVYSRFDSKLRQHVVRSMVENVRNLKIFKFKQFPAHIANFSRSEIKSWWKFLNVQKR